MPKTKKFKKLLRATKLYYTGRKVPKKYQKVYGKVYSAKEAKRIAYAIGKKKRWAV